MRPQVFLLNEDPLQCAVMYSDEHLTESIPVLIEVLRAVHAERHSFKNHILTKWCGGPAEYSWLSMLTRQLINEAAFRFDVWLEEYQESLHVLPTPQADMRKPKRWLQLLPKAIHGQPVKAYQEYYCTTQQGATWTKRGAPSWFKGPEQGALNFNL
jgi:hypothetical protein